MSIPCRRLADQLSSARCNIPAITIWPRCSELQQAQSGDLSLGGNRSVGSCRDGGSAAQEQRAREQRPPQTGKLDSMRSEHHSTAARTDRVPELDGIRGVAIAGVMLFHFVNRLLVPHTAIDRLVHQATVYGFLGVDLFFVLSGFLITGILYDSKTAPGYFRNFYIRRALRIFPLYYGVLVVTMLLLPATIAAKCAPDLMGARAVQEWVWFYLTNFYIASEGAFTIPYFSHFWSLAIEEHFYVFWPVVIAFCSRARAQVVCLVLVAIALCLRVVFVELDFSPRYPQVLTPCRLDALCAGAWFSLALRDESLEDAAVRAKRWLTFAGIAVVLCSLLSVTGRDNWLRLAFRGTALAFFFGAAIVLSTKDEAPRWLTKPLRAGWLMTLGKYSYGLYVYHGMLAYHMQHYDIAPAITKSFGTQWVGVVLKAAAASVISLFAAVASYELFELRFLALKKHFKGEGSSPKPQAPRLVSKSR